MSAQFALRINSKVLSVHSTVVNYFNWNAVEEADGVFFHHAAPWKVWSPVSAKFRPLQSYGSRDTGHNVAHT